jgi:subtilisin family serine protease
MIKKFIASIMLLSIPIIFFGGWNSNNNEITSYYYYKGQPFDLTLKNDRVFIKLKENLTDSEVRNLLAGVRNVSPAININEDEDRHFITLNSYEGDASIIDLTRTLKNLDAIEYASPVFSPDNGTTLIGVENEVIVQFKPIVTSGQANEYIMSKGMTVKQVLDLKGGLSYVLTVNKNDFAIDVANEIHNSGLVNWSEPNLYFTNLLCHTPNDPLYSQQWSLNNQGNNIPTGIIGDIDCDMDVDSAWDLTLGSNKVIIAISDTGIDTLHEDLAASMVPGTGFNFFNNTPGGWDDGNHGTACAGISAGIGDNNIGVSGVSPSARLIAVKWLSSGGSGNFTGATNATIYSYQQGAWIISNSWGFVGGASSALDQAILDAVTLGRGGKGSIFVVASGNENGAMRFPANTNPNVLSVGGISPCNQRKSPTSCDNETFWGASFGANLHVVAPCVKITTTDRTGSVGYSTGNYAPTFNGTSSATPNVAGVCGLVMAADSNQTWDTVRARITRFSEKRGAYTYDQPGPLATGQWNNEMGYGLVNAYAVLEYILGSSGAGPDISHTPIQDNDDLDGPYLVSAFITPTGDPVDSSETKVFWSRDGGPLTNSINMFRTDASTWIANIPGNGSPAEYRYYITTQDINGNITTHPAGAPGNFHSFNVNSDTSDPVITHSGIGVLPLVNWPGTVSAEITDNSGIDSAYVTWKINTSGTQRHFRLNNTSGDNYEGEFNSLPSDVDLFDTVYYRVHAMDNSTAGNSGSTAEFAITFVDKYFFEPFPSFIFNVDNWSQFTSVEVIDVNGVATGTFPHPVPSSPFFLTVKGTDAILESNVIDLGIFTSAVLIMNESEHDLEIGESVFVEFLTTTGEWDTVHVFEGTDNGFGVFEAFDSVTFSLSTEALHPGFKFRFRGEGLETTDEWFFDNICLIGQTLTNLTGNNVIPKEFALNQNYPNPFNPATKISFDVPKQSFVTLKVYDISGREIAKLVNGSYNPGVYTVNFDASRFASGVYFYRLEAGEFVQTKRMVLLK